MHAASEQLLETAIRHHQAGRLQQAELLYRQILSTDPKHADALHLLGVIASQMGRHDAAIELIQRSIAVNPSFAEAYVNLAIALKALGRPEEATIAARRAIELRPDSASAHQTLGVSLQAMGRSAEAVDVLRRAMKLNPGAAEGYFNLASALQVCDRLDEAIGEFRRCIAIDAEAPEPHNNLAIALTRKRQLDEAISESRRAIALNPKRAAFHNNLGIALREKGLPDDAAAAFGEALAINPNYAYAASNLAAVLKDKGQLDDAISLYRKAIALNPAYADAHSNLVYTLHFHPAFDAPAIAAEHKLWNLQHAAPLPKLIQPHANNRDANRPLRIGYVSPDLRDHPVGRFMLPLLDHHDKSRFQVYIYAQVEIPDPITERCRASAQAWRDTAGLSDIQLAEFIRQDQIDILVDLTMHMAKNRMLVFAREPAPVQVTYLAYCSTTGLEAMDYRLSDPYLDPPGQDDGIYSEKTIRLPETYWCYQPTVMRDAGDLPASKRNGVTFGCLNNFCKVSENTFRAWAAILNAVPNSSILLHVDEGSHRRQIVDRFAELGVKPAQLQFAVRLPIEIYFDLYGGIDIALDTFPYGGGTTTCDALWMGVPVVTLVGKTAVGRGGLSILSNLQLTELVARSNDEYVQIAVELAGDLPRLAEFRRTLRERMRRSPLMDANRFARNVEVAYRQIWTTWCSPLNRRDQPS